jgi:lipopolysaccharide/colanic/teichoic acid biosynthesis glycosyltransferase
MIHKKSDSLDRSNRPEVTNAHVRPSSRRSSPHGAGRGAHRTNAFFPEAIPLIRLPLGYRASKRLLDVFVSASLLLLLFPAFLLIALAVRLSGPGPVFYRSRRVGRGAQEFWFLKFRTMHADAEALKASMAHLNAHSGPIFKAKDDPRITPVGRILRKYSLDELPQLLHVLVGEMTMVGPRPHLPSEVAHYRDADRARLSVKPGLTCYWQVRGRSDLSFEEWIALDLEYVRDMGMMVDLKLMAATPRAVLGGKGAY